MASSEVSICNSALIKIGAARISSLDEVNRRAELCKEQYPKLRDEVQASHPWNFTIKRAECALLAETPVFDFTKVHQLPTDYLRVIKIDGLHSFVPPGRFGVEGPGEFEIVAGKKIMSDMDVMKIKYISQVTDTSQFSKFFDEVLALRIASDLAYSLTNSVSLGDSLFEKYGLALRNARTFDAQEGYADNIVESNQWLAGRT